MAKKVLYLGNGKWCWTESCKQHSAVIASKDKYLAATNGGTNAEIVEATQELMATPEGMSTYRHLKTKEVSATLGRSPMIGLDLDGTTGNFTDGLRTYMGTSLKVPQNEWESKFPDPEDYAMWEGKNAWYTDKADFMNHFQEAERKGIYKDIKVYDNASPVIKELQSYGFQFKVITARGAEFNDDTRAWILKNDIPIKTILNPGSNKHTIKDIDVYVDDAPHVIKLLKENNKKVVIMEQNYNVEDSAKEPHENTRRVTSWDNEAMVNAIFDLMDKKKSNPKT